MKLREILLEFCADIVKTLCQESQSPNRHLNTTAKIRNWKRLCKVSFRWARS